MKGILVRRCDGQGCEMASDYIWFIERVSCLNLLEEHTGLGFASLLCPPYVLSHHVVSWDVN